MDKYDIFRIMLHILFFLYCLILCYSLLPSLLKNPVLLDSLLFDIKNNQFDLALHIHNSGILVIKPNNIPSTNSGSPNILHKFVRLLLSNSPTKYKSPAIISNAIQ